MEFLVVDFSNCSFSHTASFSLLLSLLLYLSLSLPPSSSHLISSCFTEEERKARIFNSRERQMGVDRAALEAQIAEKKAQKEREAELDKAYGT